MRTQDPNTNINKESSLLEELYLQQDEEAINDSSALYQYVYQ